MSTMQRKKSGLYVDSSGTYMEFGPEMNNYRGVQATRKRSVSGGGFKELDVMPSPDKVLEKLGAGLEVYRDLMYDPHIASCLQSRKAGVMSYEFKIGKSQKETPEVLLMREVFENLDVHRIINEILDAPAMGYQPLEIYWQVRKGALIPSEVLGKPPEWFMYDGFNNLKFLTVDNPKGEQLKARKFLVARHNPTYTNPYGEALLSRCYWSAQVKKNVIAFWVRFAEKYGTPYLYGTISQFAEDGAEAKLLERLEALSQDGAVVVDEGTVIKILEATKTSSADLFLGLINFCNSEISKALLSHSAASDSTPGKLGNETTVIDVRQDIVDSDKRMVTQVFNQLIRWTCEMNFGDNIEEMPKFEFFEEENLNSARAERDDKLFAGSKYKPTQVYYERAYGFKKDELEVVEVPAGTALAENTTAAPAEPIEPVKTPDKTERLPVPAQFDAQKGVDTLKQQLEKLAGGAMDPLLAPVVKFIQEGNEYEDILVKIANVFPEMDTKDFEDTLAQSLFWASTLGRADVERELVEQAA